MSYCTRQPASLRLQRPRQWHKPAGGNVSPPCSSSICSAKIVREDDTGRHPPHGDEAVAGLYKTLDGHGKPRLGKRCQVMPRPGALGIRAIWVEGNRDATVIRRLPGRKAQIFRGHTFLPPRSRCRVRDVVVTWTRRVRDVGVAERPKAMVTWRHPTLLPRSAVPVLCPAQRKITVRRPCRRTRCSACQRTARASAIRSASRPIAARSSGLLVCSTRATSCSMIGPSSRSAVT
jgi:hypothetical protein